MALWTLRLLGASAGGRTRWRGSRQRIPRQVLVDGICVPAGDAVKPRLERVLTA